MGGKGVPEGVVGGVNGTFWGVSVNVDFWRDSWKPFNGYSCLNVSATNKQNVRIPMIEIKVQYHSREKYSNQAYDTITL